MEEEPVQVIRESTRTLLKLNRQHLRDEASDLNRSISEIKITPENIANIAQNLKTKSHISALDLSILKNGLLDSPNHKSIVLSTQGALRGLVRELTGNDSSKQYAAAGCLCNLALADGKACNTIAKAAGFYLIILLDNFTAELVVSCAWTLGNLAGSSVRVCELLVVQGALTKLCDILQCDENVQEAALYALSHFSYQLKDQLRVEHLKRILQELVKLKLNMSSAQLLFILSCHRNFPEVSEEVPQKVLADFSTTLETHSSTCKRVSGEVFCCKLIHLIRVLGNIDISKIYKALLDTLIRSNVIEYIRKILNEERESPFRDSLFWLVGNLYNFNCDNELFYNLIHAKYLV